MTLIINALAFSVDFLFLDKFIFNVVCRRKNLLAEASNFGDLTSDKYSEIQKRIDSAIQSVNPSEEYRDFTEKHRLVYLLTCYIFT